MSEQRYFSEREAGDQERDLHEIGEPFWQAFVGLVNSYLVRNRFTQSFPETCFQSPDPVVCQKSAELKCLRLPLLRAAWDERPQIKWCQLLSGSFRGRFQSRQSMLVSGKFTVLEIREYAGRSPEKRPNHGSSLA